jgi:hypothetical protein
MWDFAINLAAGLAVFGLDVILIVWLLPVILQRRSEARWAPTRKLMVQRITDLNQRCWEELDKEHRTDATVVDIFSHARSLSSEVSAYTPAMSPQLAGLCAEYLSWNYAAIAGFDRMKGLAELIREADLTIAAPVSRPTDPLEEAFGDNYDLRIARLTAKYNRPELAIAANAVKGALDAQVRSLSEMRAHVGLDPIIIPQEFPQLLARKVDILASQLIEPRPLAEPARALSPRQPPLNPS